MTLVESAQWIPGIWSGRPLIHPIFRHCWECMLEVTPSRRALVMRMRLPGGEQATIVPMRPEAMEVQCAAKRGSTTIRWDPREDAFRLSLGRPEIIQWGAV